MLKTIENINNKIEICQNHFKHLHVVTVNSTDITKWFRGLCQILTEIIKLIGDFNKNVDDKLEKNVKQTLLLYLTQMLTSLSFLINIFIKEEETGCILKNARHFISKQILHCLEGVSSTLMTKQSLEDPSGSFVKWMDLSLDKISQIDTNLSKSDLMEILNETKTLFEEVLSHAMSIAQVVSIQDSKVIRGGCQSVLEALNCLTDELYKTSPNKSMVNLFVDVCSDKLCLLERKVNTTVLKLSLSVFSKYFQPLGEIHKFSLERDKNKSNMDNFENLVANFDLHVDQIMQIGLFAVSCSSDVNRGIKIRSCLASLEALESELVPSFAAVLNDTNLNADYALILENYWMQQANMLKTLIYLIIDPFAFCQIVYEENSDAVDHLKSLIKEKTPIEPKHLAILISYSNVLREYLNEALNEFQDDNIEEIRANLRDFKNVLYELECAGKVLLGKQSLLENNLRVLKRCKVLLTVTKRLWLCFSEKDEILENNTKHITPQSSPIHNLDHIIDRGKQILKDRSILYKTPTKSMLQNGTIKNKSGLDGHKTSLFKLVHLKNRGFLNSRIENRESTLNLQISEILNEITNLSTTFNK